MNMKLRKELRDFIKWQLNNDLLKEPLTIDYELAETYLESKEKQFSLTDVVKSDSELLVWLQKNDLVTFPKDEINEVIDDYRFYQTNCV